jgi:hypothetical protein
VGAIKKHNRFWLAVAVFLSAAVIVDLLAIIVEDITKELPDPIRCRLVNTVLALPFETEYKEKERKVRLYTSCPRAKLTHTPRPDAA